MSDNMQVIVKLAERCNLNCQYCYMYTGLDQSWRRRPVFLSPALRHQLATKAEKHLQDSDATTVTLEFHGGEPLLLGKAESSALFDHLRRQLGYERAAFCLQTNGTLLDEEWCDIFERYRVSWSISCDGPPAIHNRYRLHHSGRQSAAEVERAIALSVRTQSPLFGGVLSVVDPATDGEAIVRYFHELGVQHLDLLMPDANYVSPPRHLLEYSERALLSFLIDAFDQWVGLDDPAYRIRIFEEIVRGLYGLRSNLDAFGANLSGMLVVESDGSYQLLDVLRIGGESEVVTPLNLATHTFRQYLEHTAGSFPEPSDTCKHCAVYNVCGGGYLPHRYNGRDYDRPSVHCDALYQLIAHIYRYLRGVTPDSMWKAAPVLREVQPTAVAIGSARDRAGVR